MTSELKKDLPRKGAASETMDELQKAKQNLSDFQVAISRAYDLMLENGLGTSKDRAMFNQAAQDVAGLKLKLFALLLRGV